MRTHPRCWRWGSALAALAALISVAGLLAAPAPAHALTLDECIALARRNAPALRISEAGVSRAEQSIREARAALSPTLRLSGTAIERNEAPKFLIPTPIGTTVVKTGSATAIDVRSEARLPIDVSGRDHALVRAAEAARRGQERSREEADADLVLRVSQAFYRTIAAERLQLAANEAVQAAGARRRLAASQVRAGVAQRLDSLQARVDLFQRESALIRASEAVRTSRVELETAIGTPIDSTETLAPPGLPDPALPVDAEVEATAMRGRPQLAALDEQLRENEQRIRAARAGRGPQMGLTGTAQYLGPNRDEEYFNTQDPGLKTYNLWAGVDFSLSIFDGGLASARAGVLQAERSTLEARRRQAELDIRRDVERSLSDLRVSLAIWQSDSSRVTAAREALRLAEAGYRGGTSTASQVRDAESALADARAQEAQSLLDTWSARAALERAAGPISTTGGP